jgi:hypothetical protein
VIRDQQVVFGIPDEAVVLDRNGGLLRFHLAVQEIAAHDGGRLHIVAAVLQVLQVDHVVTGLVLGIDRGRIERIHEVHRRIEKTVAPGDRLAAHPHHRFLARVARPEAVEAMQQGCLVPVVHDLGEVEQAPPVVRQARREHFDGGRQVARVLDPVAVQADQLVIGGEGPAARYRLEVEPQVALEIQRLPAGQLPEYAVGGKCRADESQLRMAAEFVRFVSRGGGRADQ